MTDKEKDLNTEQDKPASNLKVAFKPSGEKTEPFAVKKTPEQIKIENNEAPSNPLDINSNLGSFGPSDLGPDTPSSSTPSVVSNLSTEKVSTLEKIQEKNEQISVQNASNVKINFDKFERNKNVKVKTRVGIKFDS
jgi:hypothetical protein